MAGAQHKGGGGGAWEALLSWAEHQGGGNTLVLSGVSVGPNPDPDSHRSLLPPLPPPFPPLTPARATCRPRRICGQCRALHVLQWPRAESSEGHQIRGDHSEPALVSLPWVTHWVAHQGGGGGRGEVAVMRRSCAGLGHTRSRVPGGPLHITALH